MKSKEVWALPVTDDSLCIEILGLLEEGIFLRGLHSSPKPVFNIGVYLFVEFFSPLAPKVVEDYCSKPQLPNCILF